MAAADSTRFDILDVARFWSRVRVGELTECWPWQGPCTPGGYGSLKWLGRQQAAHRVAFLLANGAVSPGAVIRHSCDNPPCCNPLHLLSGTHADNVMDRVMRRRGAVGERVATARLTEAQVLDIIADVRSAKALARVYGVSRATIDAIRERRSWKYLWKAAGPRPPA